jgi:hypothetical protein
MNVDEEHMFIFPSGEGMVSSALFQEKGFNPSKDGVRVYFDGAPHLLEKVIIFLGVNYLDWPAAWLFLK